VTSQGTAAKTLSAIGALSASFIVGWMARAWMGPPRGPVTREPYRASQEEKILAARILVAVNRRRGVETPRWIAELAEQERRGTGTS
jgi:hypothetical protein